MSPRFGLSRTLVHLVAALALLTNLVGLPVAQAAPVPSPTATARKAGSPKPTPTLTVRWTPTPRASPPVGQAPRKATATPIPGKTTGPLVLGTPPAAAASPTAGNLWAWGYNTFGYLGDCTTTTRPTPVLVVGPSGCGTLLSQVVAVAGGGGNAVALLENGTVWTWGVNSDGQLGNGTTTNSSVPVQVVGVGSVGTLTNIVAIAAGGSHVLALSADGHVYAWGSNGSAQLGIGGTTTTSVPTEVIDPADPTGKLSGVVAISAGGGQSLALKSDSTLWGWGYNYNGQVGHGTNDAWFDHAVQVVKADGTCCLSNVVSFAAGGNHSLALTGDGSVWAWGANTYGQLGNNTTTGSLQPVRVVNPADPSGYLTGVQSLMGGDIVSLAVMNSANNHVVDAWGFNDQGVLGTTSSSTCGYYACSMVPVQTAELTGVTAVSGGQYFNFAITPVLPVQTAPAGTTNNPPYPNDGYTPDPVNTFTGSYTYSRTDLAIAGRGPSPVFTRAYNSDDTRLSPLGPGWTDNYAIHLASPGDGSGNVILVGPQGQSILYTLNPDGSFTAPPTVYTTLVQNADGTFTATLPDQTKWAFSTTGQLTSIADRYGNQSTLTYNASGQLVSIGDPAGRGSLTLAYDPASGRLTSVTDWTNRVVKYGYDANGRLSSVTDRDSQVTTFGYDGTTSHLTTITDANGHVAVTMTYDSQGRVATQKDAAGLMSGQQTTFAYVANQDGTQTTTVTYPSASFDGTSPIVTDTYDTLGRLVKRVTQPSQGESDTEQYSYDANSNRSSITDARGNTTTLCYDVDYTGATIPTSHGNLTRQIAPPPTHANPPVTLFKYDAKNNLLETIPPKGVSNGASVSCTTDLSGVVNSTYATDDTYDATDTELLAVTQHFTDPDLGPQTATTKLEYNDPNNPGLVTRIIPPRGNTGSSPDYSYATTFVYYGSGSEAGMLASTTDPLGNETTYTYDSVGRRLTMVDPNGNVSGGNPAAHTWTYSYDNEDRVTQVQAPAPATGGSPLTTTSQYDPVGNRTVVIDANGQVTKYAYDARDLLIEVDQSPNPWTDPNATPSPKIVTFYHHDNLGNLAGVVRDQGDSANERQTDYTYDGLNRLRTETQYPSWPTTTPTLVTSYTYDGNGNRVTLKDPLGQTTSYGYDPLNRLTSISYSDGVTPSVSYAYDANGNRTTMSDGTGSTTYSYDEMDRLLAVTSPGAKTVGYRYDLDGNRTKVIYPDSTAVTYAFDKGSRLQSLSDWANRTTSYQYFPDGNLQTVTNLDGTTANYSYDNAQRATEVLNRNGTNVIDQHSYTLDNVGNRTALSETLAQISGGPITNNVTYTYDSLYRLTGAGTTTYTYDPVGNRLTKGTTSYTYDRADRILTAGTTSYTVNANGNLTNRGSDVFAYDQANRLTSATVIGTTSTDRYDGDGKRASQIVGTSTTSYLYDVNNSLPNVLTDGTNKYVYGLGLVYAVDGSGNVQVYHTDGLGSVRAITNGAGTLIQTYQTDEFGIPTNSQGTSTQPFQYTGQQVDGNGLVYLRARYYDPTSGRFLSRDISFGATASPLTLNRYTYVRNGPVNLVDPMGLSSSRALSAPRTPMRADCSGSDPTNLTYLLCPDSGAQLVGGVGFIRIPNALRALIDSIRDKLSAPAQGAQTPYTTGQKVQDQMTKRGWTDTLIQDTLDNPSRTVATQDTRYLPGGGRMSDPATAFIRKDGSYVVRNDVTGDIVQISDRFDPGWKAPWGP